MTVRTSAGSTIAISAAQPATYDATGYAALTWTTIGEVTDLGEFGRTYALVTHNPLASRGTTKRKGSYNEGSIDLKLGLDNDDAGQIIAKTASQSDDDHSFKITLQDGSIYYFQSQVMQFTTSVGSVDSITGAGIKLELTTDDNGHGIVEVAAS